VENPWKMVVSASNADQALEKIKANLPAAFSGEVDIHNTSLQSEPIIKSVIK
jgi:hypothetical protein